MLTSECTATTSFMLPTAGRGDVLGLTQSQRLSRATSSESSRLIGVSLCPSASPQAIGSICEFRLESNSAISRGTIIKYWSEDEFSPVSGDVEIGTKASDQMSRVGRAIDVVRNLREYGCAILTPNEVERLLIAETVPASDLFTFVIRILQELGARCEMQVIPDEESGRLDLCIWLIGECTLERFDRANDILEEITGFEVRKRIIILLRSEH